MSPMSPMNMPQPVVDMTAMNVIVALALLFAAGFFVAWAISPRLRAWIEQPNYRFRENARIYDEALGLSKRHERNRL
jgi:hypothetical protein